MLSLFSCKKEIKQSLPEAQANVKFPTSEKDKNQVALIKEVGTILQDVYQNPKAFYEVCATIYSSYYEDESVLLKDLLFPQYSLTYKSHKFKSLKAETRVFKKEFLKVFNNGNYPTLTKALGNSLRISSGNYRIEASVPTDTTMQIYSNSNGVMIYFPYLENFGCTTTTAYFDNINTSTTSPRATIVSADRDADSGPGQEPYLCGGTQITNLSLCYKTVTVDDNYASSKATHIVGVHAELARISSTTSTNNVNLVFIGDVKGNNHQFDKLISFTGNGGGSELRFIRGDAYLQQNTSGQITNPQNVVSANLKRKEIRNGTWKTIYSIWDFNWETDNKEQVFGIYEEDTQGPKTFSGSVQTTLTLTRGSTQIGPFSYSITVQTRDEIVRQLNWNRESFYQYNQGSLNNGCGSRNGWTIYDCNTYVAYTMPTQ